MKITKGTSFRTILEAMQTMFNKNTGSGHKRSYYVFKSHAVWFPKAAVVNGNDRLAPPPNLDMLNVLSADESEIIEANTLPDSAACHPAKGNALPRITFIKQGDSPYVFAGVYVLSSHSADYRSRVYTKTADTLDTKTVTGEMETDE
jgi:hypothetical protein